MDILKDMKTKQNRNERPTFHRNDRPKLQDMSYNTNWKDGKPERPNNLRDTPDPLKKTNMIDDGPWCDMCRLPHAPKHCTTALSILEENNQERDVVNVISSKPLWGRDDNESSKEDQNSYHSRKVNQQCYTQQVFSNEEEAPTLRKLTVKEKRAYTIAAIEQAKNIISEEENVQA